MLNLAGYVNKSGEYINISMAHGAVSFQIYQSAGCQTGLAVTPAQAKRILEDALEALTKWTLEQ